MWPSFCISLLGALSLLCATAISSATNITVRVDTSIGGMTLELYGDAKPVTVTNLLRYIRDGRYVGTFAHRLPQGFVLQGGALRTAGNSIVAIPTYPVIVNEPGPFPLYSNLKGTISMARTDGIPDSASASWFINLKDNNTGPAADGNLDLQNSGFTVFGKVIAGLDVLERFAHFTTYFGLDGPDQIVNAGGSLAKLPLKQMVGGQPMMADFIFTTWTILGGPVPVITSPSIATGTINMPLSYQITATGSPTGFSVASGTLPAGLSLDAGTGLISGTPTEAVTSDLTIGATNSDGTGSASLTISMAPVISSSLTAKGTVGSPFHYQIVASSSPTSYAASDLPAGLAIDTGTGVISGTPTTIGGPASVSISATNPGGTSSATLAITIVKAPLLPPTVTTSKKVTGKGGKVMLKGSAGPGTVQIEIKAAKGGFKKAKGSPANWKFPVKGLKPGKYKFQVRATNEAGQSVIASVKVTIKP